MRDAIIDQMTPAQQQYWDGEGGYFDQVRGVFCTNQLAANMIEDGVLQWWRDVLLLLA